jgi:glycosyltransferase involved in cell wall biosynthesis
MNVVILDGDVSYPPTSGKRLRTLNLMLPLARRHHITYIARGDGDPEAARKASAFLAEHDIEPVIVDDPIPRKKGLGFCARLASNLFSSLPYSAASHLRPKMRRAVLEHAKTHAVDLWQVEWVGYLHCVAGVPGKIVLQAHNVETLLWQRFCEVERNPLKRWFLRRQWARFERFERQAYQAVDRVIAVSPDDAELARRQFAIDHIDVVDNGVDVNYFRDVHPRSDSRAILYLGALDWRPNLDALRLLLERIFPAMRAKVAGARLLIVGRHPPDWLRRGVLGVEGVELHADVPDVRPWLESSAVLATPLRIGGGSRLKILEALACGLPVVSTRIGAEGLALRPGEDYTLADTPEEMIEALAWCLQQPEKAKAQAARGKQTVCGRYDWPLLADRLGQVWERTAAQQVGLFVGVPALAGGGHAEPPEGGTPTKRPPEGGTPTP